MTKSEESVSLGQLVDLYLYGFSTTELEGLTGIHRSTARRRIFMAGQLRSRAQGVRGAAQEGRLGAGLRGKSRVFSDEHKASIKAARLAHGEKHAKGISIKPNGYVEFTRGEHKGRSVHRVVAEQTLGRELSSDEHAHHVDEDRANNDPGNIEVMPAFEHLSLHSKKQDKNRLRNENGTWR